MLARRRHKPLCFARGSIIDPRDDNCKCSISAAFSASLEYETRFEHVIELMKDVKARQHVMSCEVRAPGEGHRLLLPARLRAPLWRRGPTPPPPHAHARARACHCGSAGKLQDGVRGRGRGRACREARKHGDPRPWRS